MPKDACYKKVKASYDVFPSARASQAIAKCRKSSGVVRKTKAGTDLRDGSLRSGKIQRQERLVGPGVRTSTAGQQDEYLRIRLRQRVRYHPQS
jgi:hypothetical protein